MTGSRKRSWIVGLALALVLAFSGLVAAQEITFMWWTEGSEEMAQLVEEFEAENPGVTVKFEVVPFDELHDKLVTLVAGGLAPDIAFVNAPWVGDFASRGAVASLDEYIAKSDVVDPADYVPALWESGGYEGSQYGIPFDAESMGLFYRKDYVAAAGLDPDDPAPTWDAFLQTAKALTLDRDDDGRIDQYGFNLLAENPYWFYPWYWQAGATEIQENGKVGFDTPEGIAALQFFGDLHVKHKVAHPQYITSNSWDGRIPFEQGQVGMMTAGSWLISVLREEAPSINDKWTSAPLPRGVESATSIAGDHLIIMNTSKNKDAAWKFVEFLSRPENLLLWNISGTMVPPRISLADNPENFTDEPAMQGFVEGMFAGRSGVNHPNWAKVDEILGYEIQQVLYGRKTAEQAMKSAARQANQILQP